MSDPEEENKENGDNIGRIWYIFTPGGLKN